MHIFSLRTRNKSNVPKCTSLKVISYELRIKSQGMYTLLRNDSETNVIENKKSRNFALTKSDLPPNQRS